MSEIEIDTKLQDMLNLEFTNEEQQIFLQHFAGFLNKDDEFIINIEFIFKWIGFGRKDHAKRLLEKYFIINSDYKITLNSVVSPPKGENLKRDKKKEGRPIEVILLTPNCFKQLCLLANTDKGKQVRLYYIKMELILMKYLKEKNEINEKLLLDSMQMNKNLDYALQTEQKKIARILSRRVNKEEPGQLVYIYKESEFKYKIGETSDINRREKDHRCATSQSIIVYTKRCCNCKLLEKVVHHILDQYRDIHNREWFTVSFEIAKAALDSAHIFLDGLVNRCETINNNSFFYNLKNLIESLEELPSFIKDHSKDIIEIKTKPIEKPIDINLDNIVNPLDFDKFISEFCEINDESTEFSVSILAAHKQWSRCAKKTTHDALYKFLCENYKKVKVFDNNTNAKIASFKGLKLKSISYNKPILLEDIDEFINDKCELNYVSRIPSKDIYNSFEIWKRNIDPDYTLCAKEKSRIDHAFKNRFLPGLIFTGKQSQHGYYFVNLKDNPSFTGYKLAPSLKKKIIKIDINTKQIVETFESLTAAAISINRSPSTLSTDIQYKRPRDNYIYQYVDKYD